jgi:hypothetical protein
MARIRALQGSLRIEQFAGHRGRLSDDEPGVEVHHHHAADGGHSSQDIVRDVAGMVGQREGGRV